MSQKPVVIKKKIKIKKKEKERDLSRVIDNIGNIQPLDVSVFHHCMIKSNLSVAQPAYFMVD